MVICIDRGNIYYDNDISSIVSNDSFIEADSSVSLRTVQYSNRRGGWHDINVKNVMEGRRRRGGGPAWVWGFDLFYLIFFLIFFKIRISILGNCFSKKYIIIIVFVGI